MERALVLLTAAPAATRRVPRAASRPRGLSVPDLQATGASAGREAAASGDCSGTPSPSFLLAPPGVWGFELRPAPDAPPNSLRAPLSATPSNPGLFRSLSVLSPTSRLPLLTAPAYWLWAVSRCFCAAALEALEPWKTEGRWKCVWLNVVIVDRKKFAGVLFYLVYLWF